MCDFYVQEKLCHNNQLASQSTKKYIRCGEKKQLVSQNSIHKKKTLYVVEIRYSVVLAL